jgi:hypothetical protein
MQVCELVAIPLSSFDAWVDPTSSPRYGAAVELVEVTVDISRRFRTTFGASRIYGQQRRLGVR